jgi:hypothetical protein
MAVIEETGVGGVIAKAVAALDQVQQHRKYFATGDVAFSVRSARIGLLERIVIRKQSRSAKSVLYTDRDNRLWSEGELVDLETARAIVAQVT